MNYLNRTKKIAAYMRSQDEAHEAIFWLRAASILFERDMLDGSQKCLVMLNEHLSVMKKILVDNQITLPPDMAELAELAAHDSVTLQELGDAIQKHGPAH